MNVDHSNVECTVADYYAGDFIDKLDELKTNIDERAVISNAGAWALGRKTDELIITQLDALGAGQNVTGAGDLADTAGFTKAKVFMALEMLNNADVPDDGQRFAAVSPGAWTDLMLIDEFVRSDYVGQDLPYRQAMGGARDWLGVKWIRHSGLSLVAGDRQNYLYHKTALGHAIGADVTADITWEGTRAAHWVNHMMSQGACRIDDTGVVRVIISE